MCVRACVCARAFYSFGCASSFYISNIFNVVHYTEREGAWLYLFRYTNNKYRSFLVSLCTVYTSFLARQRYRRHHQDKPLLNVIARKKLLTKMWMFANEFAYNWRWNTHSRINSTDNTSFHHFIHFIAYIAIEYFQLLSFESFVLIRKPISAMTTMYKFGMLCGRCFWTIFPFIYSTIYNGWNFHLK